MKNMVTIYIDQDYEYNVKYFLSKYENINRDCRVSEIKEDELKKLEYLLVYNFYDGQNILRELYEKGDNLPEDEREIVIIRDKIESDKLWTEIRKRNKAEV